MKACVSVFGVYHHFELAQQLLRRGHLETIYSTWPWARVKREGVPRSKVNCFPAMHLGIYLLGKTSLRSERADAALNKWNTLAFDRWTRSQIQPCDVYIAASGSGLLTGRKVQAMGGKFLCDRGSTHQSYQEQVVAAEYERWGVQPARATPHIAAREQEIYEQADAITVPSTTAKRSFVAMGVAAEKVHVIPYGVRLDRFKRTAEPEPGAFHVLFAGQVSLRKGFPYLLQAFAQVKHPFKKLTVVGAMQDDVRRLLPSLPQEQVTFAGSMPQAKLAAVMSASHLLVLPSIEEGLALVQGQAMACGCPVLATPATGAEDLFTDGVDGFIVPERDADALAARMQQVADDPALQQRLSEASLRRVKHLGGWTQYGDAWDRLLHQLTGLPREVDEPDYVL